MKYFILIICILLVIWLANYLYRLLNTRPVAATVEGDLDASVDAIWKLITDYSQQAKWRSDLSSVESLGKQQFVEIPKQGKAYKVKVLQAKTDELLELGISGEAIGVLMVELTQRPDGTRLNITKRLAYKPALLPGSQRTPDDLQQDVNNYLEDLKAHFSQAPKELEKVEQ
ncbi:SRPBCC family protein [Dongshaea marina]|uniref:SRPBCC family protein n=1 Tax=Dongshaea marina TaxID=2047966 RepID=UPI000D3E95DC|nr:SRPBCC family protein [Dongshaea marina]